MSLSANIVEDAALPVVDVSGLHSPHAADRAKVAADIRSACLDKGFMYVVGHGVDDTLRQRVFDESARFFALSDEEKAAVDKKHSPCNRGYEPLRAQTLEPGTPPDLKEGFYLSHDLGPDHPAVIAGKFNHGPNQWPADRPDFQATMEQYFSQMLGFGETLMRGVALSLDLDEGYFTDFCHEPGAVLRLLHYPPQPGNAAPDEKGCGAHTDFGGLTVLMQDDVGGLQVWDEDAGWVHAPPIPGSYIVNLGDMIARWTNDRYRSTLHRVVNATGKERYSVPFFYSGNPDYEVSCLPTCLAPGETPRYAPTTVEGHMQEMYRRTYVK